MPAGNVGAPIAGSDNYFGTALNDFTLFPEVLRKTILQHPGEAQTFESLMRLWGKMTAKKRSSWYYTSRGWFMPSVGVNANVPSPGVGVDITFAVPAADHTGNGEGVPVRVKDILWLAGGIQGTVSAVTNTAPNVTTVTLAGRAGVTYPALTTADRLVVGPNSMEEFNGPIDSMSGDLFYTQYKSQQIREDYRISGRAWNASLSWTDMGGKQVWYLRDLDEMELRFKRRKNMAYLNQDPTMTNADPSVTYMTGLIPFIQAGGQNVGYTVGSWGLSDLNTMIDALDAELINDTEFTCPSGLDFLTEFYEMVRTMLPNGAITYGTQRQLEQDLLGLNFKGINYKGYRFHFGKLQEFTHPQGMGAPGFPYRNYSMVLPMGNVADAINGSAPKVELVYLADNGGNRKDIMQITGAEGPRQGNPTDAVSHTRFRRACDTGTFYKEARCFGLFTP